MQRALHLHGHVEEVRVQVRDADRVNEVRLCVEGQGIGELTVEPFTVRREDLADARVVDFEGLRVGFSHSSRV